MLRKIIATALLGLAVVGCSSSGPSNPGADSDSQQVYGGDATVPTDTHVYDIVGTVTGDPSSLTRQQSPGHGEVFGANGFVSGSFFGPVETGKGFVRITVVSSTPEAPEAPKGGLVVLKMTDTKGTALLPGDIVHFRCRRQYEAIAAVQDNEKFDVKADGTWELDYCRLATPEIEHSGRD